MALPSSPARRDQRLIVVAFLSFLFATTVIVAAAWSERSEARSADKGSRRHTTSYGFRVDEGRDFSYAILGEGSSTHVGTSSDDWDDLRRLQERYDRDVLWFSLRGRDWVVLDDRWIDKARDIVAPMNELGARQGQLGAQQARLGTRQAAIGARQARIGARQAVLSTRLASMSLEGASESEQDGIQVALDELSRKMEALGREHEPLGRQQEELGRRQEELGRQMERLSARVNSEMRQFADRAIDTGAARRASD